jgi:D-glycero-alpha-D-manno-heptose-7-phosphate kinase
VSRIRVTARCRVDFAGGTLDIWPLGLLHPGSATVNVAADLPVVVELEPRSSGWIVVQGEERRECGDASELAADPGTALVGLVAERAGLAGASVSIASASPRGAGLGASSALTVALLAAAEVATTGRLEETAEGRAAIARDLEARLMSLPTGRQDHFPAQLGGALAVEHRAGGERIRRLATDLAALGERWIVAYTGQSHFSAGNNWQVIRSRLDGEPEITARLDRIRDVARDIVPALESSDWPRVGALLAEEWEARRGLAEGISTARLEELLASARRLGAWGGKACGAGGGGCLVVLAPPERRREIEAAWRAAGARVLPAAPTDRGIEVDPR